MLQLIKQRYPLFWQLKKLLIEKEDILRQPQKRILIPFLISNNFSMRTQIKNKNKFP